MSESGCSESKDGEIDMSNEIIITNTDKRMIVIDIQSDYTNKKFDCISISREFKGLRGNYNTIVLSTDELKKICKHVFKIVIGKK